MKSKVPILLSYKYYFDIDDSIIPKFGIGSALIFVDIGEPEKTFLDIQFKGNNFSPKKLKSLTNLPLEVLVESGQIAKKGRYKGKPSPFGIALLQIEPNQKSLSVWCDKLLEQKSHLDDSNVQEIIFDIESTNTNFSITPELSNKLSRLQAVINFTKIPDVVDEPELYTMKAIKILLDERQDNINHNIDVNSIVNNTIFTY